TLQKYFSQELTYCISNFLFSTTEFEKVIYDITRLNRNFFITKESQKELRKNLFSFLNSSKEEITKRD
ncbi:MAG TPA: hypothetical protein VFP49_10850, partial [Nitrososphaeraceae archaeon]|nr:hypothetical protein [Nitrososphaeraceae archaeon]